MEKEIITISGSLGGGKSKEGECHAGCGQKEEEKRKNPKAAAPIELSDVRWKWTPLVFQKNARDQIP